MIIQQIHRLAIHLHLQQPIHARLALGRQSPLPDQPDDLVPPARDVHDALGGGFGAAEAPRLENHFSVSARVGDLEAEDAAHGGLERGAELELVEAAEAPCGVHDPIVIVHSEHKSSREGVTVEPGHRRHRKRQVPPVEAPEGLPEGVADAHGVRQVQPVGEELGQRRGGHHDAGGQARQLDQVQGPEEGLAEGDGEPVVGRGGDGDEVVLGQGLGDGDGPARVAFTCRDRDCEEGFARGVGGRHGRGERELWMGGQVPTGTARQKMMMKRLLVLQGNRLGVRNVAELNEERLSVVSWRLVPGQLNLGTD